jgi:hypothetical protein
MALRGTLKDFGIADIFQLIGHQGKTGRLVVENRDETAEILFFEGNVVRATPRNRETKDLLGSMLVRAEVITKSELERALESQHGSQKRLGALLVETTSVDRETLQAFARLQTTETLYRLFLWNTGSYAFENADIPKPEPGELIRSENVLMESFRQVDEWPEIRKKITGYGLTFFKLEDLDELLAKEAQTAHGEEDLFGELDSAFAGIDQPGPANARLRHIGDNERLVYALITPERDVQKIIDLSRLGEFETCKALCNLIEAGVIEAVREADKKRPSADATVGGINVGRRAWLKSNLLLAGAIALLIGGFFGARHLGFEPSTLVLAHRDGYLETAIQEVLARGQMQRLHMAIHVFRAETGQYPQDLRVLVDSGLLDANDLSFPWLGDYAYERTREGYVLAQPFF